MYYLQHNKDKRVFIDKGLHRGHTLIRELPADSWIAARCQVLDYEFKHKQGHGYEYSE